MTQPRPIVVTAGEPAGVGPEICLALSPAGLANDVIIIGDPDVLRSRAELLGVSITVTEIDPAHSGDRRAVDGELFVLPIPFPETPEPGRPSTANSKTLLEGLRLAVAGCQDGTFSGIVTAPVQKSTINDAGIPFSGHTEFLAGLTATARPVMLLVAGDLRVALATTHLPLRDVPDFLSAGGLRGILETLHAGLRSRFGIDSPRIAVCGLNPHAGEGGHLGTEDSAIIAPVVRELADRGFDVHGPLPADTAFTPAAGQNDAVLAMYHDQGLPVLKFAGFGHAVNVTLGLPVVRTSVDHGTALDIAGTGKADAGSLVAAVRLALQLAGA